MAALERPTTVHSLTNALTETADTRITYRANVLGHMARMLRGYMLVHPPPAEEAPALARWSSALEAEALLHQTPAAGTRQFDHDAS